jgi:hypothetical protein
MKTLILTATLASFALSLTGVAQAAVPADGIYAAQDLTIVSVEKRKKKRVKGGSGCDSAHDIAEHPECR